MTPTAVLKTYAHQLQLAAPKQWEEFCRVFDAYADTVTVAVMDAEQHEVLQAQGRAKAFRHLSQTFRTCHVPPKTETASGA